MVISLTIPAKWAHGTDTWTFDMALQLYVGPAERRHDGQRAMCLGDRMVHPGYGAKPGDVIWVGSTSTNWHGYSFKTRSDAETWLLWANHQDLGCALWSKTQDNELLLLA